MGHRQLWREAIHNPILRKWVALRKMSRRWCCTGRTLKWRRHIYFVVGDQIIIVDRNHRIIAVIDV
jgi:hypothetical protein